MSLQITTRFDNGKVTIVNRRQFESLTKTWNGEYDTIFSKKRKKRSNQQSRYYWGCVVSEIQQCLIESQGEFISANETHEFLKLNFNFKPLVNKRTGEVINIPRSTTELTTLEFEEFLDKVRGFALDFFGCEIPMPNEQKEMAL